MDLLTIPYTSAFSLTLSLLIKQNKWFSLRFQTSAKFTSKVWRNFSAFFKTRKEMQSFLMTLIENELKMNFLLDAQFTIPLHARLTPPKKSLSHKLHVTSCEMSDKQTLLCKLIQNSRHMRKSKIKILNLMARRATHSNFEWRGWKSDENCQETGSRPYSMDLK